MGLYEYREPIQRLVFDNGVKETIIKTELFSVGKNVHSIKLHTFTGTYRMDVDIFIPGIDGLFTMFYEAQMRDGILHWFPRPDIIKVE